jgi:hypothetical protein
MRELSRRAFPEPDPVPDGVPAPIEQDRAQCRCQAAVIEAAALRRARAVGATTVTIFQTNVRIWKGGKASDARTVKVGRCSDAVGTRVGGDR